MSETTVNKNYSLSYCLPHNSKANLDSRTGDDREGLLGYENDGENYGTLRLVDNNGKAIIPMAGIKTDLIWEGSISPFFTSPETIILSNSINNYKFLSLEMCFYSGGVEKKQFRDYIVDVNKILKNKNESYVYFYGSNDVRIYYYITYPAVNSICVGIYKYSNYNSTFNSVSGIY